MQNNMPKFPGSKLDAMIQMKSRIINSLEYKEKCAEFFEVFKESRIANNPEKIFQVQEKIFNILLELHQKKPNGKADQAGSMFYALLIQVVKSIADSVAWRTLGYNRFLAELFISHPQTGALNHQSSLTELEHARSIVEQTGAYVLLNDLTNYLRFGDITVLDRNGLRLEEVKMAGKNAKGSRISRQMRQLEVINNFLSQGTTLELFNYEHLLLNLHDYQPKVLHKSLEETIEKAKVDAYGISFPRPYLSIEVFHRDKIVTPEIASTIQRPFADVIQNCITFNPLMPFNDTKEMSSSAPFGIFPFSDEDCFALMSGELALRTTLDVRGMSDLYGSLGIQLAKISQDDGDKHKFNEAVFNSPTGSKEQDDLRVQGFLDYYLLGGDLNIRMSQTYFSQIVMDLFEPEGFVFMDKFKMDTVRELIKDGKFTLGKSNLHLLTNERSLWK